MYDRGEGKMGVNSANFWTGLGFLLSLLDTLYLTFK